MTVQLANTALNHLKAGDRGKAKRVLIELLRHDPDNERAWILLSRCVSTRRQKLYCLKTILEINPDNKTAQRALSRLKTKPRRHSKKKYIYRAIGLTSGIIVVTLALISFYQDGNAAPGDIGEAGTESETSSQVHSFVSPDPLEVKNINPILDDSSVVDDNPRESETELIPLPDVPSAYCVPKDTQREVARVVQVISPNTILVSLDDENFPVKYIGVDASTLKEHTGNQALEANRTLEGETVTLVHDQTDEHSDGTLPRYVFIGDTFVNFQLLEWGLGTAVNNPPNDACAGFFMAAQENAQSQQVGAWARPLPSEWKDWPIVPDLSEYSRLVYMAGLATGNDPNSFSVIGDCQSLSWRFLGRIDWDSYQLPKGYDYLQPTIDHFSGDYSRDFVTVRDSATVATMFSVIWADPNRCQSNETPLECEFRINNPSIILISLGTNWKTRSLEEFETHLRNIIQFSLDDNVLPIIATKADSTTSDFPLNMIMAQAAYDYDIPLWNFWAAVQHMPLQGMNPDDSRGIHIAGNAYMVKRVTALQTLNAVLTAVEPYFSQ